MNCRDRKTPKVAAAPGMITAQKVPIRPIALTIRKDGTRVAWTGIIMVASSAMNITVWPRKRSLAKAKPPVTLTITDSSVVITETVTELPNQVPTGQDANTLSKLARLNRCGHSSSCWLNTAVPESAVTTITHSGNTMTRQTTEASTTRTTSQRRERRRCTAREVPGPSAVSGWCGAVTAIRPPRPGSGWCATGSR